MNKPVGGRGNKVPYDTVVMRVPSPLVAEFRDTIEIFYDHVNAGILDPNEISKSMTKSLSHSGMKKSDALVKAKEILKTKKSARQSVLKLLQVIYGMDITDEDLKS
jgi:hypothetical protein